MTEMTKAQGVATILLVDDQDENLFVLEEILAGLEQKIIKATTGEQALKCILNNDITVVIMDVTMPGMSGFETAALIRERDKSRHIPIIFVTGLSVRESHMFQGYSLGGVDYILKPIIPEILRAKVKVFVELYRQRVEINDHRQILQEKNQQLQSEVLERKRAEEQLLELNKTLEARVAEKTADVKRHVDDLARSNAELEQFAHIVSHDLQEPLRKIVNFSQILQENFPSEINEKAKSYLGIVVDGALRMKTLIQDLLEFSQIDLPEGNLKRVDTAKMLEEMTLELEPVLEEAGARVQWGSLPPVWANPTQLRRVFQNLVLNAIKFRSKEAPVVQISAEKEGDFNVFSIKDNGIGIAKIENIGTEYLKCSSVFIPVENIPAAESDFLSVKRSLSDTAEKYGWNPNLGQAQPFGSAWPRKLKTVDQSLPKTKATMKKRKLLLYIDDDIQEIEFLKYYLEGLGEKYDLMSVEDGAEALKYLRKEDAHKKAERPDLILLDLNMPRIDGHEVLREIKADSSFQTIPVIIFTSSDSKTDLTRCNTNGADYFLTKPIGLEGYAEVIKTLELFLPKD